MKRNQVCRAHAAQFIVSLKTIRYSSIKHSLVLFKYDYTYQSKRPLGRSTKRSK